MSDREDTTAGTSSASAGGPGSGATSTSGVSGAPQTVPEYSTRPVTVRRPDVLAAVLLLLAGVAAGISLLLRWLRDSDVTGSGLVRRGFESYGIGIAELLDTGFWQPLAVVLGGGALFVLGLLLLLPARTHRLLGGLALLVSLLAAAAVLVPLGRAGWDPSSFAAGFWFAVAVAALGLLGSLKAVLTGPKRRTRAAQS